MFEMCVSHGHYWRSVWKSALLGTPETAAESWLLIHCTVSFPEKQACSALWGKTFHETPRTIMLLKEILGLFYLPFDACISARLVKSSAGLTHGFENLFRPRLWPGPFRSHRRVVAIKKKNLPSFCLAGHGKAIVENVPDVRTPMNSKRDRHGCKGKTSVTSVPCFPFWVCPLCWKLPSCSKVLLSWRKWSMPWVVEVDRTACPKNPWLMYPTGIFLLMEIKGFGSQMGRHLGGKWLS